MASFIDSNPQRTFHMEGRYEVVKLCRLVNYRGQLVLFQWRKSTTDSKSSPGSKSSPVIFDLFYQIFSQQTSETATKDRITDWQIVPFPWIICEPRHTQLQRTRIVGLTALYGEVSLPQDVNTAKSEIAEKYAIVSDPDACHIFRFSERNTILYNRFTIDEEALTNESVHLKLLPHLDARFRRSQRAGFPADEKSDALDVKAIDGKLFYEPSYEIAFPFFGTNGTYKPEDFTVVQAPTDRMDTFRWFIISYGADKKTVHIHTFLKTADSPLEVEAIVPAIELDLFALEKGLPNTFKIKHHPSAVFYYQSKEVRPEASLEAAPHQFKGEGRLMVSLIVGDDKQSKIFLIDIPLNNEGKIPRDCFSLRPVSRGSVHLTSFPIRANCIEAKLLASADGYIHCYFIKDKENEIRKYPIGVYLYDPKIKSPRWTSEDNTLTLIGNGSDPSFNEFNPTPEPSSHLGMFNLKLDYCDIFPMELWCGIPRIGSKICDILNGKASDDLYDPLTLQGHKTFYDYQGKFRVYPLKLEGGVHAYLLMPRTEGIEIKSIDAKGNFSVCLSYSNVTFSFDLPKTVGELRDIFLGSQTKLVTFSSPINVLKASRLPLWIVAPPNITSMTYSEKENKLTLSDGSTFPIDGNEGIPFIERLNVKLRHRGIFVLSWLTEALNFTCEQSKSDQEKLSFFSVVLLAPADKDKALQLDSEPLKVVEQGLYINSQSNHQQRSAKGVFAISEKPSRNFTFSSSSGTSVLSSLSSPFKLTKGQQGEWMQTPLPKEFVFNNSISPIRLEVNQHDLKLRDRWTVEMWLKPSGKNVHKIQTLMNCGPTKWSNSFHSFQDGYQLLLTSNPSFSLGKSTDDKKSTYLQSKGPIRCDLSEFENFCWDFWVRLEKPEGTHDQVIIETRDPGNPDSNLFQIGVEADGKVFFIYQKNNQERKKRYFQQEKAMAQLPLNGEWFHVAVLGDKDKMNFIGVSLYINGIYKGTHDTSPKNDAPSKSATDSCGLKPHPTFLFIGCSTCQPGVKSFSGNLCNLRLSNHDPSREIQLLMRNAVTNGLVISWPLSKPLIRYSEFPKPYFKATITDRSWATHAANWDLALESRDQPYKLKDHTYRSPLQSLIALFGLTSTNHTTNHTLLSRAMISPPTLLANSWNHAAVTFEGGRSLFLQQLYDRLIVPHSAPFYFDTKFAVDGHFSFASEGVLFSKWGCDDEQQTFLIEIKNDRLCFTVTVIDEKQKRYKMVWKGVPLLLRSQSYHFALTFQIDTEKTSKIEEETVISLSQMQTPLEASEAKQKGKKEKKSKKDKLSTPVHAPTKDFSFHKTKKMYPTVKLYLNGKEEAINLTTKEVTSASLILQPSECDLCFGMQFPDLKELSIIQNPAVLAKLARFRLYRDLPPQPHKLYDHFEPHHQSNAIAAWPMNEEGGTEVIDLKGKHHGRLSRADARDGYTPLDTVKICINSREVQNSSCSFSQLEHEEGFLHLGSSPTKPSTPSSVPGQQCLYTGSIGELRVWSCVRPRSEICRTTYTSFGKYEPNLLFSSQELLAGSASKDSSINLPVGLDAPELSPCFDKSFDEQQNIYRLEESAEYIDATEVPEMVMINGNTPLSYMQRAYFFPDNGINRHSGRLLKGFCVGSLENKHIGQTQTAPSILGFIEGPPPIPGENLTFPYWKDVVQEETYSNCSEIILNRSITRTVSVANQTNRATSTLFSSSVGLGTDLATFAGFMSSSAKVFSLDATAGTRSNIGSNTEKGNTETVSVTNSSFVSDRIGIRGRWVNKNRADLDPIEQQIFDQYGRRWKPLNYGYALVSSTTAEVWASFLRGTNQMVDLRAIPNPNIPEDRNIVMFKMKDTEIEVGRLDDKVGTVSVGKGLSYFQPEHAYAQQKKIEEAQKRLEASLSDTPTETVRKGRQSGAKEHNMPKVGLVNSYIWTQKGGLHTEETQFSTSLDQVYEGSNQFQVGTGLFANLELSAFGAKTSLGLEFSTTHTRQIAKSLSGSTTMGHTMLVTVKPDEKLEKYNPEKDFWEATIPAGRVDTYRFKAFYLQPAMENFDDFCKLIDPEWLHSSDPDAVLIRSARKINKAVWRLFYRVTFIRRVGPQRAFSMSSFEMHSPPPPGAIRDNLLLINLFHQPDRHPDNRQPDPAMIKELCKKYNITDETEQGKWVKLIKSYFDLLYRSQSYHEKLLLPDCKTAAVQLQKK